MIRQTPPPIKTMSVVFTLHALLGILLVVFFAMDSAIIGLSLTGGLLLPLLVVGALGILRKSAPLLQIYMALSLIWILAGLVYLAMVTNVFFPPSITSLEDRGRWIGVSIANFYAASGDAGWTPNNATSTSDSEPTAPMALTEIPVTYGLHIFFLSVGFLGALLLDLVHDEEHSGSYITIVKIDDRPKTPIETGSSNKSAKTNIIPSGKDKDKVEKKKKKKISVYDRMSKNFSATPNGLAKSPSLGVLINSPPAVNGPRTIPKRKSSVHNQISSKPVTAMPTPQPAYANFGDRSSVIVEKPLPEAPAIPPSKVSLDAQSMADFISQPVVANPPNRHSSHKRKSERPEFILMAKGSQDMSATKDITSMQKALSSMYSETPPIPGPADNTAKFKNLYSVYDSPSVIPELPKIMVEELRIPVEPAPPLPVLPTPPAPTPIVVASPAMTEAQVTVPQEDIAHLPQRKVLHPFVPERDDEIPLSFGDLVAVEEYFEDGWCVGFNVKTGEFGAFPQSVLKESNGGGQVDEVFNQVADDSVDLGMGGGRNIHSQLFSVYSSFA